MLTPPAGFTNHQSDCKRSKHYFPFTMRRTRIILCQGLTSHDPSRKRGVPGDAQTLCCSLQEDRVNNRLRLARRALDLGSLGPPVSPGNKKRGNLEDSVILGLIFKNVTGFKPHCPRNLPVGQIYRALAALLEVQPGLNLSTFMC